jgi:hypothetical protein
MIRNASRLAATSVALFMLASPAFAQQAQQPSASHLAAGRDVAISSGMTGAFDAMTGPLLNQLQQIWSRSWPSSGPRSTRRSRR